MVILDSVHFYPCHRLQMLISLYQRTLSEIRPEFTFLSLDRLSCINDVALDKVHFRPDVRQNLQDIKSLCGPYKNLELLYLVKCQTWVSTFPSASNRTSAVSEEHLVALSCTLFAYAEPTV